MNDDSQYSSKLLIEEPPLQVLPSLAVAIGLNEAIFLQQLHYLLRFSKVKVDGRMWTYNSYDSWAEVFPFWSVPTIRRTVTKLRELGLILTRDDLNELKVDNTLWFSIDRQKLSLLDLESVIRPSDQIDQTIRSNRSDRHTSTSDQYDQTNTYRIKEDRSDQILPEPDQRKKGTDKLSDDSFALLKESYQRLSKFGPPTSTSKGREALALATRLVESYGFEKCLREVSTVKERHDLKIQDGGKGIDAPLNYLASILDNEVEKLPEPYTPPSSTGVQITNGVVNFLLSDLEDSDQ